MSAVKYYTLLLLFSMCRFKIKNVFMFTYKKIKFNYVNFLFILKLFLIIFYAFTAYYKPI